MIYQCQKCGLSKSASAMGSVLPQCKCDWQPTPMIQKPAREWVGLTETEKYTLADDVARRGVPVFEAICEAEAKLREKNT